MPFLVSPRGKKFLQLPSAAAAFGVAARNSATSAAEVATQTSRATFADWLVGRPLVPERRGRKTTGGDFEMLIAWEADQFGMIRFDQQAMDERAWYWIIQEIGTGKSAHILSPGGGEIAIPSQKGRALPRGFYWGNEAGHPADGPGLHNLYPYEVGAAYGGYANTLDDNGNPVRMKREIRGKHFVRDGGKAGFTQLRQELRVEFRQMTK